ncbi:MAG: SPFH domain-containing protein [Clostridia bacterium]|jgi:membrane protease subunit (stomatin/prohibitin family)|nr:SPFH domain-containing protein [Clostridia bacterium]
MGLIKAGTGALGGVLADQWKEFFYSDSLGNDVLLRKGTKRVGKRSSNTKASDNIISNGSGIAVADGQCMIIVEQGKVVEICAEPGEYTYDTSTEPSIFSGKFGESLVNTFKILGKRFTYGGDTGKDQRVYYFNTKEILGNRFGTVNPIPFRVADVNIGLDIDVSIRCSGTYSYVICDPIVFYSKIAGNVADEYTKDELDSQMRREFVSALTPSIGKLSALGIRPSAITAHTNEIEDELRNQLSAEWKEGRGIEVKSIALNPIDLPEEQAKLITDAQRAAILRDPTMAAATLVSAQASAMEAAANNSAGAMTGFMGMGMAMNNGSAVNPTNLYAMGNAPKEQPAVNGWNCSCGNLATGKFCTECGSKKPDTDGWKCSCGALNKGKFCSECGSKKPAGALLYKCDKCGWEPEDPAKPPKFCPECGDVFNESDVK